MRNIKLSLCIVAVASILYSCQKEVNYPDGEAPVNPGGNNNSTIIGDYNFVGLSAHTNATVNVTAGTDQLKTITTTDYISKSNGGTAKITSNQFIYSGLSYVIDTVGQVKTYVNGILFDVSDFPFSVVTPPTDNTSSYVKNSSDSITVTGAAGIPSGPNGSIPTGQVGLKYRWSADTLIFTMNTTVTQSITQGGIPATVVSSVNGTMKFKRK